MMDLLSSIYWCDRRDLSCHPSLRHYSRRTKVYPFSTSRMRRWYVCIDQAWCLPVWIFRFLVGIGTNSCSNRPLCSHLYLFCWRWWQRPLYYRWSFLIHLYHVSAGGWRLLTPPGHHLSTPMRWQKSAGVLIYAASLYANNRKKKTHTLSIMPRFSLFACRENEKKKQTRNAKMCTYSSRRREE